MNELRTLPEGLGELVARQLVAIRRSVEVDDLALASAFAAAARRRAGRVAAVREASAIVAYLQGEFTQAIQDLRAVRRMTGSAAYIPMIADCERGLGRPQKALDLVRTVDLAKLDVETKVEILIVAAGARADLGKVDAAVVTLQVPELTRLPPGTPRARLQYAYSDLLLKANRKNEAWEWMERAAASDILGETDAAARCDEFAGVEFAEDGENA